MSLNLEEKEKEMVLALSARERYVYFIQLTVDGDEAWGLKNSEGWVLAGDEERDAFPVWPHAEFAAACALGDWEDALPESIGLDELLQDLIPILEEDGLGVAVFPSPEGDSAVVTPEDFRRDLQSEIELGGSDLDETPDHEHDPEHGHDYDPETH